MDSRMGFANSLDNPAASAIIGRYPGPTVSDNGCCADLAVAAPVPRRPRCRHRRVRRLFSQQFLSVHIEDTAFRNRMRTRSGTALPRWQSHTSRCTSKHHGLILMRQ